MTSNPDCIPPVPTEEGGELKPCPFCASEAIRMHEEPRVYTAAECRDCGARGPIWKGTSDQPFECEAVDLWNTRPTQAPQDVAGLVEEALKQAAQPTYYPDFLYDKDGLDRWRESSAKGNGHDMCANQNTVQRFVQTIDRLRRALDILSALRASPIGHEDRPLVLAAADNNRELVRRDKEELTDLISDAISDSMDMDWNSRDGARAVVAALVKDGIVEIKQ